MNHPKNEIQIPRADGRALFKTIVLQTKETLPNSAFVSVELEPNPQACRMLTPSQQRLPDFALGSLVFWGTDNTFTHAGMIHDVNHHGFTCAAWTLEQSLPLRPVLSGPLLRPQTSYRSKAIVEDEACHCNILLLSSEVGKNVLTYVGLDLPEHLLQIYWGETDLEALRSSIAERKKFAELVNAQLAELAEQLRAP